MSSISEVLAANLSAFMESKGMTQAQLAQRSGIAQTTVSLYLHPTRRQAGASGRSPSPTLAGIHALAVALDVEVWELLIPLTSAQRGMIHSIQALAAEQAAQIRTDQAPSLPAARKHSGARR